MGVYEATRGATTMNSKNIFTPIPTISSQILSYLKKHKRWVSVGELESIVVKHNGSSTSRICRYMAEDGDIKKDYKKVVPRLRPLVFYHI
jgi:hypothetical protein